MVVVAAGIYFIVVPKLPSIESLKDVQFQVPLRIFSRDDRLIAEYGEKKRTPMDIEDTPKLLINAVLAAEDDRFFEHPGVDYKGIFRAVFYLLKTGEKGQGGSTITMQVARNFFLSREKTYLRKLNEILLALKIERALTKLEILELYINKIYLGNRSYGFGAASQVYYGKDPAELLPAQAAMIAGLPKAPSAYNPIVNPKRALLRRNYVLNRMYALGFLTYDEHQEALNTVDDSALHSLTEEVSAPYLAEMVRAEMVDRFGNDAYTKGYRVYTSVDSRLQTAANDALRMALLEYDERHGYRGPEAKVEINEASVEEDWRALMADFRESNGVWPALVIDVKEQQATVYQPAYGRIVLDWKAMDWARPWRGDGLSPGQAPKLATEILQVGDVVRVVQKTQDKWQLSQLPNVEGALVSLSPHDGAVLALVGGFDFSKSSFNRVIQAERQPGSNFKPFTYSAALERGFTAASVINDAPVVFEDAGLESTWRPENYSGRVFGPTRLREALVNSRNLVSIRLLRAIGISYAIDYATRFGFNPDKLPRDLSLALGSAAIKPMELVTGYAAFANGGYKVDSYYIDRIENDSGEILFKANPARVCEDCDPAQTEPQVPMEEQLISTSMTSVDQSLDKSLENEAQQPGADPGAGADAGDAQENPNEAQMTEAVYVPQPPRVAPRIVTPQNVYIMTSILRDIIQRGTGRRAKQLGRNDIAGKTGTTNDQRDAWFSGFSPDVVTTAWVGFDNPKTLGERETGGRAALPMWIYYMREALKGLPEKPLKRPPGLVTVRIDPDTGLLANAGNPDAIFETFREDQVPQRMTEETVNVDPTGSSSGGMVGEDIPEQLF
ncbi:MAG: penicillin-binding protein 1A [Gammaproteobacteria bacterium]|nr:penicillin-binding protein 1A [Gammaproteobacteria bacterium]